MRNQIITEILKSYPFIQYNDDENVVAFFDVYNEIAQEYLTAFNNLSLPCWTSPLITGYLLDWIAHGIYGQFRPAIILVKGQSQKGDYNTVEYNVIEYAHISNYRAAQYNYISDDLFKRVLTWNFYKTDGFQFSIPWLKRRISRFIHGKDGIDPPVESTSDISVTSKNGEFFIDIPDYGDDVAASLKSAMEQGFVKLPFIYRYNIKITRKS